MKLEVKEVKKINLEKLKQDWYKIFYVKWVFDKFHLGHKEFLIYLRKKINYFYGDKTILIVGIESDRITKKKKWKNRPYDNEKLRAEKVYLSWNVDAVYISDNEARYLIDELKFLKIDYFIVPEEYVYYLKLFYLLKNKLKKDWIKIMLSRHKQYERFWLNSQLATIHTTGLVESNPLKVFIKHIKQVTYLTKELLYFLLKS